MKSRELRNLGIPAGVPVRLALDLAGRARAAGMDARDIRARLRQLVGRPVAFCDDPVFGELARLLDAATTAQDGYVPRADPAPFRKWGSDLDPASVRQLVHACELPVAVRGALMPDAHPGYGLPIGGVLATRDAVIPYAVGVDIACRMKLSVLDVPPAKLSSAAAWLQRAIESETRFGIGANFTTRRSHDVMDADWRVSPVTERLRDKAWSQLGTSGSGNHFVEFGLFEVAHDQLGVPAGTYLALLSHSGSRGAGATVASHFSRRAMDGHPELPKELKHLAWLPLDSADGQEYWAAMELMGRYAAANHACIHRHVAEHLGAAVLLDLENHHNFAWREVHDGETVIVHRKGATPAGVGMVGIIPGSMASSTYIVRGRGNPASLNSAAHGAGRLMSRTQANKTFRWSTVRPYLEARGVTLLSAGLDEVPMVYKDIEAVMAAQADLVEPLARFHPRLVKMAPAGERAED
jgi:tRNA-splicing ligase RtcB (3'-phosphate/5'-hydroxy nucleic acid ligase)